MDTHFLEDLDTFYNFQNQLSPFDQNISFDDFKFPETLNQFSFENQTLGINNTNNSQVQSIPTTTGQNENSLENSSQTNPQISHSIPAQQMEKLSVSETKPTRKRSRNMTNIPTTNASTEKKTRKQRAHNNKEISISTPTFQEDSDDEEILESDNENEELASLPPAERKKRIKEAKLLKNREAAQQFRQRQREHISALEQKVKELMTLRAQYITQAQILEAENKLIRSQVEYLRNFLSEALTLLFSQQLPQLLLAQNPSSHIPVPPQVPLHTTLGPIASK